MLDEVSGHSAADERVEQVVGNVLRLGVLIAATVTALGGIAYLWRDGRTHPDYHRFVGTAPGLHELTGIVAGARALDPASIVQLGIVLLIATPIARVALTLGAFAYRKDRLYTIVSAIVLALLAYGLLGG